MASSVDGLALIGLLEAGDVPLVGDQGGMRLLQIEGLTCQARMIRESRERFEAYLPFSDGGMAVNVAAQSLLGVIQMECTELIQSDLLVDLMS